MLGLYLGCCPIHWHLSSRGHIVLCVICQLLWQTKVSNLAGRMRNNSDIFRLYTPKYIYLQCIEMIVINYTDYTQLIKVWLQNVMTHVHQGTWQLPKQNRTSILYIRSYFTQVIYNIRKQCTNLYLAIESLAEQDVPCCQVPVDKPSPWEVPHTLSNLLAEGQQLLWQTFISNGARAGWEEQTNGLCYEVWLS